MIHATRIRRLTAATLLLLSAYTPAQTPLEKFQQAVLAGDATAARAQLAQVEGIDPPTRATLQAAEMAVAPRAMAMQQLARIYPRHPIADTAIVAGCAALLSSQGRFETVPGLDRPESGRKLPKGFDLVGLITGYRALIVQRREDSGDAKILDDAEWMLRTLSVTEVVDTVRRVPTGGRLPVPSPLAEEMNLRFYPWDLRRPLIQVFRDPGDAPIEGGRLRKGTHGQTVATPPAGVYVVELTAVETGWSRLERLVVSDLTLITQSWPGRLAVMASTSDRDGKAEAASAVTLALTIHTHDGKSSTIAVKSDAKGLAVFALPATMKRLELTGKLGAHTARLTPMAPEKGRKRVAGLKTHLMVDRPIYRPGETVQGRVLLRRQELKATSTADGRDSQTFVTRVARDREVEVQFWPDTKQQVILRGRTDGNGVFVFATKLAMSAPLGGARVHVRLPNDPDAAGKPTHLTLPSPFRVQEFRRPVILAKTSGPTEADRQEPFEVTLQCRYAAGAPAVGLRADVTAHCGGLSHRTTVALDGQGTARIPIHVHALPLPRGRVTVRVVAEFHSPDGQRITKSHYTEIKGEKTEVAESRSRRFDIERIGDQPTAGQPLRVRLSGMPGDRVLLTTVRDVPLHFRVVQLDTKGRAEIAIPTAKDDFPGLQLVASQHRRRPSAPILSMYAFEVQEEEYGSADWRWGYGENAHRETFLLAAPGPKLAVEVSREKIYRPGSTAKMSVTVTRDGKPARCAVAVTIVDETIYALEADRNRPPTTALQPLWTQLMSARVDGTQKHSSLWHILGRLLRLGGMEAPAAEEELEESMNDAIGLGGGAGGRFGGRRGGRAALSGVKTRKDFRPTAFFVGNLQTDADGRAAFQFAFPDDLTRWRITAIAVDDTFRGAKQSFATETRLPVAVTAVLPRVLRTADEVEVSVTANKEGDGEARGRIELTTGTDVIAIADPSVAPIAVQGSKPSKVSFTITAKGPGLAKVTATATVGDTGDRAELPLPVLADIVVRPVAASSLIQGKGTIALPRERGLAKGQTLRLLGNRDALLREAAQYLDGYPYGCVEQVLSRLTPLFVAARSNRLTSGSDGPNLTEEQGLRLEAGMVALRAHLLGSGRGFRWWHGSTVDKRMTALALHALMLARQAGIDPERYGVKLRCDSRTLTRLATELIKNKGVLVPFTPWSTKSPNSHDAELVVALLRYDPRVEVHHKAVTALLAADQKLAPGLVARIGLALRRAGDRNGARRALQRILTGDRILQTRTGRGTRFPLDRVAARTAHLLELMVRIDPKHAMRPRTVGQLLALQRDGRFGSTYSTAAAVNALALDAQLTGHAPSEEPIAVTVVDGDRERIYTLSKANGFAAECALTGTAPVAITIDGKSEVHALLRGGVEHPGSSHPGWKEPIHVVRRLFAVSFDATGKETRRPIALDAVPHGQLVELAIDLTCAEDISYLVVECPLPAGFEVAGRPGGVEVRDDRLVQLIRSLSSTRPVKIRVPMIAAHKGAVAWPPAVAQAMYQPEMTGASRGARLAVVSPETEAAPTGRAADLLTHRFFTAQLTAATKALRDARGIDTTRSALYAIDNLFFTKGNRAALPLVEELYRRFARTPDVLYRVHRVLAGLPEATRARSATLSGKPSILGFLVLAYGGQQPGDGDKWQKTLRPMLQDDVFAGLSLAERRPLLLNRFGKLVAEPWRSTATRLSTKHSLLHSDTGDVSVELAAWPPVLRAAVSMLHSQPRFGSTRSPAPTHWLDPIEIEFGAAPSANWKFAHQQMDDLRWRLVEPLIAKGVNRRLDWLHSLRHSSDRGRVRQVYDRLLRSVDEKTHQDALRTVLGMVPTELRKGLGEHYLAALDHEDGNVRWTAFANMPQELRAHLPEAVLRGLMTHSEGRISRMRDLGARGIRIVRQWLIEGRSFLEGDETCVFLGDENLNDLPIAALARLADTNTIPYLTKALARAKYAIADLQMAMHDNSYGPWRICLVEELGRRGAKKLLIQSEDPLKSMYERLLGAWRGEVAETLEVARRLRADDAFRRASGNERRKAMPHYLRAAFVRSVADRLQSPEFLKWKSVLGLATRTRVLSRYGLADWRYLLTNAVDVAPLARAVPKRLERTLLPELLEAGRKRSGGRRAALQRILAVNTGEKFLRDAVLTKELPITLRKQIAAQVFGHSGESVNYVANNGDTLTFAPTDTGSVATQIRRKGFATEWSANEAAMVRTLLRWRGILPATR